MDKKYEYILIVFAILIVIGATVGLFWGKNNHQLVFENKAITKLEEDGKETAERKAEESTKLFAEEEKIDSVNEENTVEKNKEDEIYEERELPDHTETSSVKTINKLVTWGYQSVGNKRSIDTIIIHSSYDALGNDPYSVSGILQEYKDYEVSAHYLIDREGEIYKLVEENDIAFHAGESQAPDGRRGVNAFSIGIELINTKTDKYTSSQYDSLRKLISAIKARYQIKYTLGHSEIAPGRKDDPWGFDWGKIR